jgi:hypothetical protein
MSALAIEVQALCASIISIAREHAEDVSDVRRALTEQTETLQRQLREMESLMDSLAMDSEIAFVSMSNTIAQKSEEVHKLQQIIRIKDEFIEASLKKGAAKKFVLAEEKRQ